MFLYKKRKQKKIIDYIASIQATFW